LTLDDPGDQRSTSYFDSKYLGNGYTCEVGPREHLYVGPTGFRLALSDLTLDDLEGSKIKTILFDVKYVKNGNSYDVGPNGDRLPMGFTLDDLERLQVMVTIV